MVDISNYGSLSVNSITTSNISAGNLGVGVDRNLLLTAYDATGGPSITSTLKYGTTSTLEFSGPTLIKGIANPVDTTDVATKSYTDTHINSTSNPHAVTKSQIGLGNVENLKSNIMAATAPTVNDDSNAGYSVGSLWVNTITDIFYFCVDSTVGAAIWSTSGNQTVSNIGTSGVGVFKQKLGDDIQLKKLHGISGVKIVDDTGNNELDIALDIVTLPPIVADASDEVAIYDVSGAVHGKITIGSLSSSIANYSAESITITTTTSSIFISTGVSFTPVSGTYNVTATATGKCSTKNGIGAIAIGVAGVAIANSQHDVRNNIETINATQYIVTVDGSQTIDLMYKKQSGTGEYQLFNRNLIAVKVG